MAATVHRQRRGIQSIERAASILGLLAGPPGRLGVAELAYMLGLPKGTVHGILRTLRRHGLVEQDPDSAKYQLGPALVPLGHGYLDANRLRAAALHPAYTLAGRTGANVRVAIRCGLQILIIHHLPDRDGSQPALATGRLGPLHATALGRALLTREPSVLAQLASSGLERFTAATITDPPELQQTINAVRRRGWASEIGELSSGAASIAAPIEPVRAANEGAIGIDGPIDRICEGGAPRPELAAAVVDSGRTIARLLGGG